MWVGVITLFPEMLSVLDKSIIGRAQKRKLLTVESFNPRDFADDSYQTVDDRPYGGGPGMLMMVEPLRKAIGAAKAADPADASVVYLTPQGRRLDQQNVRQLSQRESLILICGHYEGIDERLICSEVDEEWSIGDYVLSGGELAAMVIVDSMTRLIPGVLGSRESCVNESFSEGLLEHPQYTRPAAVGDASVPETLLSGNHEAISQWCLKQALGRTWQRRPDLLSERTLSSLEETLLNEFISEQS